MREQGKIAHQIKKMASTDPAAALSDADLLTQEAISVLEASVAAQVSANLWSRCACISSAFAAGNALNAQPHDISCCYSLQVAGNFYNQRANRGLLRLYQIHPARANATILTSVLVKALMALPEPDFLLSLYLIPEAEHTPVITMLISLEALLQKGKFAGFWALLNSAEAASTRAVTTQVAGFENAIRDFIIAALNRTYSTVEKDVLAAALGVADATGLCASKGWGVEEGSGRIQLPALPENTARPKRRDEESTGLKYSEIAGLVQSLSRQ